jgi:peptide/nickel transport system substrate-binding protein
MIRRRDLLAASAAAPLLPSLAAAQSPPGVIVMAKDISDIISLDPHESFEYSGNEVTANIYQKLVNTPNDNPAALQGDLAERWEIGSDNRSFTFILKQGPRFASGQPVTAADAAYSLGRAVIMNKSPAFIINQFGFTKDNVAQLITAPDARTLRIQLPEATSPSFFLYCLSANVGAVVERAVVAARAQGDDQGNAWLKQNSAGSGPYRLVAWRASENVTLEANPNAARAPRTRRIIIRHITDPQAQFIGLRQGDFDIARDLGSDQIRGMQGNAAFNLRSNRRASLMYMAMNQRKPELARPEVREAIKWSIDYDGIQRNIVPYTYTVHQTFLPAGFPAAIEDRPYRFDPDRAKALLAQAGLGGGFDVTLDVQSAPPHSDIAQVLQANFAAVGIRLRVLPAENRAVITKTRARQHELALVRWGADYFDPHTNAETFNMNPDNGDDARNRTLAWRSSWKDDDLTARAVAALRETDAEKRVQMYADMQRDHQRRSPFAIMMQEIEMIASRANVQGLDFGPMSDRAQYHGIVKA